MPKPVLSIQNPLNGSEKQGLPPRSGASGSNSTTRTSTTSTRSPPTSSSLLIPSFYQNAFPHQNHENSRLIQSQFLERNDEFVAGYLEGRFSSDAGKQWREARSIAKAHYSTLQASEDNQAHLNPQHSHHLNNLDASKFVSLRQFLIRYNFFDQHSAENHNIPLSLLFNLIKFCSMALERVHREYIVHLGLDLDCFWLELESPMKDNLNTPPKIQNCHIFHFHYSQILNTRVSRVKSNLVIAPRSLQKLLSVAPEVTQHSTPQNQVLDIRADLYSLGCIFFRLATRESLFGKYLTYDDLLEAQNYAEIPIIKEIREDIPFALQQMIAKLLNKDPNERYASTHEVLHHIDRLIATDPSELSTLDLDENYRYLKPLLHTSSGKPQMLISPMNCVRKAHFKTIEKSFLKTKTGTPGVVLLSGASGVGKKNSFNLLTAQYRHSCIFASTYFAQHSVAHAPIVLLARNIVDQIMRLSEHRFQEVSQLIRSNLMRHESLLTSLIPELCPFFGKEIDESTAFLPEPDISSSVGDTLCALLELFCVEGRQLCIFVERIDLAGTFCWKIFDTLLKPNHNFLLIGCSGSSKEERLIIKANYRRLRKSGVHVNNCQLDAPKSLALKSMIFSTLMGIPGTTAEAQHAKHALMSPMTPQLSGPNSFGKRAVYSPPDELFQPFAETVISKSSNKPIMVIEILLYLKDQGLIVPASGDQAVSKHHEQPLLWTPKWKEATTLLKTKAKSINFILCNLQTAPPVTMQIMEIASILDSPFSLADMARFTKKDESQLFADIVPALCEGWILNNGVHYTFAHSRYRDAVLSSMTQEKINQYLDDVISDTLSHLKEKPEAMHSDYIFHVIQWIRKRFQSASAKQQESSNDASSENSAYSEYLEDYATLSIIACRKLLSANLPKTANNYAADVYSALETSRLSIDPQTQYELDYIHAKVQYTMGNFSKTHTTLMKLIEQSDFQNNNKRHLRVLSVFLVNGLACEKHNECMDIFLKHCNQLHVLSGFVDMESSVKQMITQKHRKLESLLMQYDNAAELESIFSTKSHESTKNSVSSQKTRKNIDAITDTDTFDCDVKALIEAEGLVHICKQTNMQHYVLFGLAALEHVLESAQPRPSTSVALLFGALALLHLQVIDGGRSSSPRNMSQYVEYLLEVAKNLQDSQVGTLRYAAKYKRLSLELCSSPYYQKTFTTQHKQLVELHKECNQCKEPSFLCDVQDIFVTCLSGTHSSNIYSSLNKFRSPQTHLRHNPSCPNELRVIVDAAKTYVDILQDPAYQMEEQQQSALSITPSPGGSLSLSESVMTPESPSSKFTAHGPISFAEITKFDPKGEDYDIIHSFALGRFAHHLFSALFFSVRQQFQTAWKDIQKVLLLRDVVGGQVLYQMTSFFIVRIAAEMYRTASTEKARKDVSQIIAQEVHISEKFTSEIGKCVHYYCRANHLKCTSGHNATIQYIQLLQKSIRLGHQYDFKYLVGVVSLHLVETFQELEFSETVIHSTMQDALEAWKSLGAPRTLRRIREKHGDLIDQISKLKPSPIVLPRLESMSQVLQDEENKHAQADQYFVQCLAENGIDIANLVNKSATVSQDMAVLSVSIRHFEKMVHNKSSQEIYDIIAEYISRSRLILRKYNAIYEVLPNTRIVAYFPNSMIHAVQAVIEIHEATKELQREHMNKQNSPYIRISAGIHNTQVILGHLNRVKCDASRIDLNYGGIVCPNFDEVLWYEQLANAFHLSVITSETVSKFVGESNDIGSRFLGHFQAESTSSNSNASSSHLIGITKAQPLYEIYSKEWKKGTNYREFNRGVQMFQDKKFVSCANVFSRVSKGSHTSDGLPDHVAKLYVEVCRMYKQITLPEKWNGEILLSHQVHPLPVGNHNSSFYLQRGISTTYNSDSSPGDAMADSSSVASRLENARMLQENLDEKTTTVNSLNEQLTQKEDRIIDLQAERDTLDADNKDLLLQLNRLRAELFREQKLRKKSERKFSVLSSRNGGFKLLGCVPVPASLLVSPVDGRKSGNNRVHVAGENGVSTPGGDDLMEDSQSLLMQEGKSNKPTQKRKA